MADLPLDIIVDIFAKMPAKSLCRFKCLSKSYMALITNPRFVKLHQTQNQQRQSLVAPGEKGLHRVDLDTKITTVDPLDLPIKKRSDDSVAIYGSCNGLLCLSIEDESATEVYFIYNCSTREFKRISYYEPFNKRNTMVVSLGYAQSIDDFKVLGVSDSYGDKNVVFVHVFSLRNNTWKTFENTNFFLFYECRWDTSCLNGNIHFGFYQLIRNALDIVKPTVIAAFDFEEDKFKLLAPPHDDNLEEHSITNIGKQLCLISRSTPKPNEFWIMKEYGVKESWTRISIADSYRWQPFCYFKDSGFILCLLDDEFVLLDPKDGTFKDFVVEGFIYDEINEDLHGYAESLISPNSKANFLISEVLDNKLLLFDPKDGTYKDFVIDGFQENLEDYAVEACAESA